jgi:diacylglycerol kinase family enzyme
LAYIPCGTVNDIASNFKISKNINKAVKNIETGTVREIDIMKMNDVYSVYIIAAGTLVPLCDTTTQSAKKLFGKFAYYSGALKEIRKQPKVHVKITAQNGAEITFDGTKTVYSGELSILLIAKSRHIAGFRISDTTLLDDGQMEIVMLASKGRSKSEKMANAVLSLLNVFIFRRMFKIKNKNVVAFKTNEADISALSHIQWYADGEKSLINDLNVRVCPRHIKLVVPAKALRAFEKK